MDNRLRKAGIRTSALVASGVLGIATAGAAGERDAQLRPSVGIGKIRLGMTLAQVRRVLGPPQLLQRRVKLAFGREHREYMWNWFEWTVALRGTPGRLRVVRVTTTRRNHRYRGLGVGSRVRDVVRLFPSATCSSWHPAGTQILVPTAGGRQLRFVVGSFGRASGVRRSFIEEVVVQEALPPLGVQVPVQVTFECPPDWRRR